MQVNTRAVLERCIDNGIQAGLRRAYKHVETPTQETIAECIDMYIWLELMDYFLFPETHVPNTEPLISNGG
jgi:hypothetical protein